MKALTLGKPPNLKDPRIERRAKAVLALAYDIQLSPEGMKRLHNERLYAVIGQPNRSPGSYFKTLFIPASPYSKDGRSYGYVTNSERVQKLADALGVTNGLADAAHRAGKSFLTPPGPRASQPRTGDRYYPWWVTMRREHRIELFLQEHGQGFDYDLEAAKPALTLQVWRKLMAEHRPIQLKHSEACRLPTWTALVADRKAFRQRLAAEVEITEEHAKWVCQSVLNSGVASPRNASYVERLGVPATKRLMANDLYQGLRADFQTFWRRLRELPVNFGEAKTAGEALSAFYNDLERRVMDVIEQRLPADTPAWFIHDGFMTVTPVDTDALERAVQDQLNLSIRIDCTTMASRPTLVSI
jgi:hypothetical protein